jgi:hypothetical protein
MFVADIILLPFVSVIDANFKTKILTDFAPPDDLKKTVLMMAVVFPFFEELFFRYHLKFPKGSFFFYIIVILIVLITLLIKVWRPQNAAFFIFALIAFTLILTASALFIPDNQYRHKVLFIRYFPLNVWFSALLFGLVHIFNYQYNTSLALLLSPFIVLPQFFGGMVLSYTRLKHGIFSSMFVHGFHNLVIAIIIYLRV